MKNSLLLLGVMLFSSAAFAGPCLPGSLQDYIDLSTTGCTFSAVQFFNFELAAVQATATPIDPNLVQVTPGGAPYKPTLFLALNSSAMAGELFELFFRFNAAADALTAASISLGSPQVTGDGAVTGILDVCAGGEFLGIEPIGCSGTPATAIAFAIESDSELFSSLDLPASSFFDVFTDITVDGGLNGFATLDSAAVSVTTPEPSTMLLVAVVLAGFGIVRTRRARRS